MVHGPLIIICGRFQNYSRKKFFRHRSDYSNYFRFKKEKVRASMVFMVAIQSREPLWSRI